MENKTDIANEPATIYLKLSNIQFELSAPKEKENQFGDFKYRSCEDILQALKPLLKKNELVLTLTDEIVEISGRFYVKATARVLDVDSTGGAGISAVAFARETETRPKMDAAQITGSASSYARKYALNGLFCIDDNKDIDSDEYAAETTQDKPKKAAGRKKTETAPAPEPVPTESAPVLCNDCGAIIADSGKYTAASIIASTKKSFGVPCCFKCGSLRAQRLKAEKAAAESAAGNQ